MFKDISYLWMLFFIMISAGLAKEFDLFASAFSYIRTTFKNNKIVVALLSAVGGILPIEGRVTISAGLLDSVSSKSGKGREKLGIVDYLATHHYYMWSPLEKTVILPIAAFGLSYTSWLMLISPLLIPSFLFISWYIWTQIKEEEIFLTEDPFKISAVIRNVLPMFVAIGSYAYGVNHILVFSLLALYYMLITQQWGIKKLLSYVKWDVLAIVGVVIVVGNYIKLYSGVIETLVKQSSLNPHTLIGITILSVFSFVASFFIGSSGKFIALAVLMAKIFGMHYFLWFFALDFAGYLLSPTHKCVAIGNRYFGTPLRTYYKALGTWAILLILVAGIGTFIFN